MSTVNTCGLLLISNVCLTDDLLHPFLSKARHLSAIAIFPSSKTGTFLTKYLLVTRIDSSWTILNFFLNVVIHMATYKKLCNTYITRGRTIILATRSDEFSNFSLNFVFVLEHQLNMYKYIIEPSNWATILTINSKIQTSSGFASVNITMYVTLH